jgi:hypothetical protein
MIKDRADGIFWNLEQHVQKNEIVNGAIYVIGREQALLHSTLVHDLVKSNNISIVYSNPNEGSEPMEWNLLSSGYTDLLTQRQMIVVTGGDINPAYTQLLYENFLCKIHDYNENMQAVQEYADKQQATRPYKFLFLNGRLREHRKYLLHRFRDTGLINEILWTNLDSSIGVGPSPGVLTAQTHNGLNLVYHGRAIRNDTFPVKYLPAKYEVSRYRDRVIDTVTNLPTDCYDPKKKQILAKEYLFKNEWGEIYLSPESYLDTYFSLVSETGFMLNRSFRTEKIWKPIAIGHPFIVASNQGYYKDLQNLGFRTFNHLIDESFDTIDNNQDRIDRIVSIVEDLCRQDLPSFVTSAQETCKYNQALLEELGPKLCQEFPDRLFQFINQNFNE